MSANWKADLQISPLEGRLVPDLQISPLEGRLVLRSQLVNATLYL